MMTLFKAVLGPGGTASAAGVLKHPLGGKTGTTTDFNDAWFIGFSPSITCGVWVGYDSRQTLGDKENGGRAALPAWIDFMKVAIADRPDEHFPGDLRPPPTTKLASGHTALDPLKTAIAGSVSGQSLRTRSPANAAAAPARVPAGQVPTPQ
jgi:penicillin-binding protein 1A